jgi:hypothetical protein
MTFNNVNHRGLGFQTPDKRPMKKQLQGDPSVTRLRQMHNGGRVGNGPPSEVLLDPSTTSRLTRTRLGVWLVIAVAGLQPLALYGCDRGSDSWVGVHGHQPR